METAETTRAADIANYTRGNTAISIPGHVEDTDLFTKIFNEVYDQYQQGHLTEEIDQLSAILAPPTT